MYIFFNQFYKIELWEADFFFCFCIFFLLSENFIHEYNIFDQMHSPPVSPLSISGLFLTNFLYKCFKPRVHLVSMDVGQSAGIWG